MFLILIKMDQIGMGFFGVTCDDSDIPCEWKVLFYLNEVTNIKLLHFIFLYFFYLSIAFFCP